MLGITDRLVLSDGQVSVRDTAARVLDMKCLTRRVGGVTSAGLSGTGVLLGSVRVTFNRRPDWHIIALVESEIVSLYFSRGTGLDIGLYLCNTTTCVAIPTNPCKLVH